MLSTGLQLNNWALHISTPMSVGQKNCFLLSVQVPYIDRYKSPLKADLIIRFGLFIPMIPPTYSKKGTRFFSTGSAEYLASIGIVVWIWADMCWAIKLL